VLRYLVLRNSYREKFPHARSRRSRVEAAVLLQRTMRLGLTYREPEVVPTEAIATEISEWARGYALGQRLSGEKALRELRCWPRHLDPIGEIMASG
jgi:hypothetical protein